MDLNAVENLREDLAMVKPKEYMGGWSRTLSEIIGREVKRPRDLTNSELSMLRDELDTRARQLLEGAQRTSTETKAFRDTMSWMHEEAVPFRRATYSRENWRAEFGKDLTVQTPIGEIKVGEHQADKLESMMRERYFGLIKPTLQDPLFVFGEPGGKMVFVKTFIEKDVTHFASVAVDKYGLRIVISNHPLQNKELRGYLSEGRVLYDKRIRARQ